MQRAAEIAQIGMETAVKTLRAGITENEVAAEVEYAMRKSGGHGVATPVFVNSGIRSGWLHGTASDKVIEEGDLSSLTWYRVTKGIVRTSAELLLLVRPQRNRWRCLKLTKARKPRAEPR
jgi:Xaa-Pro aminopeptidase